MGERESFRKNLEDKKRKLEELKEAITKQHHKLEIRLTVILEQSAI